MNTISTLATLLIFTYTIGIAQDTLYIYKSGAVVTRRAVTDIDSIIFYDAENTVKDVDGNVYRTVTIGNQTWMAENLRTTRYRDNTPINYPGNDTIAWQNDTAGAYAWYNNDKATYKYPYGALYNWHAVKSGKLCPTGWRISFADYLTLFDNLGGASEAGGKLKEAGTTHWMTPNTDADNSSHFTGLPGGYRTKGGTFSLIGERACFWDLTIDNSDDAMHWDLYYYDGHAGFSNEDRNVGHSVRCIKD